MAKPFRWSIARREQLGQMLADTEMPLPAPQFLNDLRTAAARILAMAENADLAFIGRTPENFYDYLSGAFSSIDEPPELHLVQFSLRWAGDSGVRSIKPEPLSSFMRYLKEEGADADSISVGARSLALVDFVAQGGTMQNFVELLHLQAERDGVDWNAVQRKLRIVGLRARTHNSPNTWRWQQHQDWLALIPDTVIKNVSAPTRLLDYIANDQPKVTHAFHPGRWEAPEDAAQPLTPRQIEALAFAVQLYDIGQSKPERTRLAAEIARQPQMRNPTLRSLVSRLKV